MNSSAVVSCELGGGFISIGSNGGPSAILAPRVAAAGVLGMMSPASVNAREPESVRRWLAGFGFSANTLLFEANQVHGTALVRCPPAGSGSQDADGLWSDEADVVVMVRAADCAPIWLADRSSRRFALLHAGWRGVATGIIAMAVATLRRHGTDPMHLTAAVGPHLQACCFEVGPEVAKLFASLPGAIRPPGDLKASRRQLNSVALDLSAAIFAQLREAGMRDEQIFIASACTRCHPHNFHSYRRNGPGGPLMAAVAVRKR